MTEPGEQSTPFWIDALTKVPGFVIGFFLGVLSGYFGNWAWEKWKPRKKEPHLKLEVENGKTHFSGMFPENDQSQYIKVLREASKFPAQKKQEPSEYNPPDGSLKT